MALLDFFLSRKKSTANIAKERLQIIVAERRRSDAEPHYLPQLRKDILEVICKYVQIDPEMVTEVLDVIKELAQTGITMLLVTHEMGFAREVADRIIFMDNGTILEDAPPAEFFAAPKTARAQEFLKKML